jgi:hypothetical protein
MDDENHALTMPKAKGREKEKDAHPSMMTGMILPVMLQVPSERGRIPATMVQTVTQTTEGLGR